MRTSRLIAAAVAALALVGCRQSGLRSSGDPHGRSVAAARVQSDRFGVVGRTSGRGSTALLDELGVGWIRIPVDWKQVEPRRGSHNWRQVTESVQYQARERPGLHIMVTLRARSPWAGRTTRGSVHERASVPPRSLDEYYAFVHGMAARGKGVVDCWQIENEMEGDSWWAGTSEDYVSLLRTAHRAVRAADPSCQIALGGFTSQTWTAAAFASQGASREEIARELGYKGASVPAQAGSRLRRNLDFVNDVLRNGSEYFDVVDMHLYHRYETIPMRVQWLRDKMREYGYEKPIWATEVGGPDPLVVPYDQSVQAREVIKRTVVALASGVERVFWLGLVEMPDQGERFHRMGLTTVSGKKKPAFRAYQLVIRKIDDLRCIAKLDIASGYGFRFEKGERVLWVLWADEGGRVRLQTDAAGVAITASDGREQRRSTTNGVVDLELTDNPVFVEPVN